MATQWTPDRRALDEIVASVLAVDWCCEECVPDSLPHVRPLAASIVDAVLDNLPLVLKAAREAPEEINRERVRQGGDSARLRDVLTVCREVRLKLWERGLTDIAQEFEDGIAEAADLGSV